MSTTLKGTQIALQEMPSAAENNLLRFQDNGLYVAVAAAANVSNQFVSSSVGNDNNDGTRANPLKTLAEAFRRLPEGTQGYINLYETDTFPLRTSGDPTTWGVNIDYFGSVLGTGTKSVLIVPYGPQDDFYRVQASAQYVFAGWLINAAPRPIIEVGHYMYNGRPVGCGMSIGTLGGQSSWIHGCDIRLTPELRAICQSTDMNWTCAGNEHVFLSVTGHFRGCKFPDVVVTPSGRRTAMIVSYQATELWQCSIPANTAPWLSIGGTSTIDVFDSGPTVTDKDGTTYPTVTNTVATNIASRTLGVVKDSLGIARNVFSNITL